MGCSPSNSSSSKGDKDNQCPTLTVQLVNPTNQQVVELKYNSLNNKREDYLMNIMNTLFFTDENSQKIDVCFNSLYNKRSDRYHYYLYRLLNIEMENIEHPYGGKMWVLYIHNKPSDWDQIVNGNVKYDMSKGGKLIWKYEQFSLANSEHIGICHELSQVNNLDYLKKVGSYEEGILNNGSDHSQTKQLKNGINQNSNLNQDKSTADHTQASSLKRASQEVDEFSKKKFVNGVGTLDAPSSLFNPEIQGNPNTKKLLVTESSHIYSTNINYLNTEDDARMIQPPLQTEACQIENSDYRNVFETQQNDDSIIPDKTQLGSFNAAKKSYQVPGGSIYKHNTGGIKDQIMNTQCSNNQPFLPSDKIKENNNTQYYDGDENIISEKETCRRNPQNQFEIDKKFQPSNTYSNKFQENYETNQQNDKHLPK